MTAVPCHTKRLRRHQLETGLARIYVERMVTEAVEDEQIEISLRKPAARRMMPRWAI